MRPAPCFADVLLDYSRRWPGLQAARWGGEEFLVIYAPLQDADAQDVQPVEPRET
jgi:GGDEF domain-containing protein